MSDPVAEAAAKLAALSVANMAESGTSTPFLEQVSRVAHELEAKVEHLMHPETVPNVTPGSPVIADSATLLDVSGQPITNLDSVKPSEPSSTETPAPASAIESAEPSTSTQTSLAESDLPNVLPASTSGIEHESEPSAITGSIASSESGEVPNAVSGAAESTTGTASAQPASGSGETSSIGENSARPPLHELVAEHLESIYRLVRNTPATVATDTSALKTHVGDILHRLSNGMAVSEGELVQKLESLYRML